MLAHACQSSLILGKNSDLVPFADSFGREIALAWQVHSTFTSVSDDQSLKKIFPIYKKANTDLQSYKNTSVNDRDKLPLSEMFPTGVNFNSVVSQLEKVRNLHVDGAFRALSAFPNNDATTALKNIALALKY